MKEPKNHNNSANTIKRIFTAYERVLDTMSADSLPAVHVSIGNSKIGRTMNVSTAPVVTCSSCAMCGQCAKSCYAVRACARLGLSDTSALKNAWLINTAILFSDRNKFFADIETAVEREQPAFFRWHVSGEFLDNDYFSRMVTIAANNPSTRFLAFTKAYNAVNQYIENGGIIPPNFSVLFSAWRGTAMHNPYGLAECHVRFPDGEQTFNHIEPAHRWQCNGDCTACQNVCGGCWFQRPAAKNADGKQDAVIINLH